MQYRIISSFLLAALLGCLFPQWLYAQSLIDPNAPFVFGVEKDYPPYLFADASGVHGIAYDYASLIAKKMDRDLVLSNPMQLADLLEAAKQGTVNLLGDVTKTDERDAYLAFSDSYVETPAVVIARKGEVVAWGVDGNRGVHVAVGKGYAVASYLQQTYPNGTLIELSSDTDVLHAVALGAADVGVLDTGSLSYLLQQEPLSNIEVIAESGFSYSLAFAVPDVDAEILPAINAAIDGITPDERNAIYTTWLSTIPQRTQENVSFQYWALVGALGAGFIILLGVTWMLRRVVRQRTVQLERLNRELDQRVDEQSKKITHIVEEVGEKNADLENTKRAILNILEDVQAEKEHTDQVSRRLKLATESANMGVWDMDVQKKTLTVDEQLYALLGLPVGPSDMPLDALMALVHEEDRAAVEKAFHDAIAGASSLAMDYRVLWRDGSTHVLRARAIVLRDETGKALEMIGVNWDVTKENEVDRAKSEFVSLASHQLRTPLSAINWFAEILAHEDAGPLNADQKEYVEEIRAGSQRMVDLVNSLLNVSRLDLGTFIVEPKPTNIVTLVKDVVHEQAPTIEKKKLTLHESYVEGLGDMQLDPQLARMVVQNLVSNAMKYTREQGSVTVEVRKGLTTVDVVVTDTGLGIPKEQQKKLFQKLFRADNVRQLDVEGTGLGLYIVKTIMESSGGAIAFTSEEGKGSVFTASFPYTGMIQKKGTKALS